MTSDTVRCYSANHLHAPSYASHSNADACDCDTCNCVLPKETHLACPQHGLPRLVLELEARRLLEGGAQPRAAGAAGQHASPHLMTRTGQQGVTTGVQMQRAGEWAEEARP